MFTALSDDEAGESIARVFDQRWPFYEAWLLTGERRSPMPSAAQSLNQLNEHMPELIPAYERLTAIFGAREHLAQFLCLYNPCTFIAGCSQAIWQRDADIALIRNYDFPLNKWDALQLRSNWNGTGVIAMTDCFWGVLDGINEHGLAVSLSFGGKLKVGDGFAITLVLRYILEFCSNCRQAEAVLGRIPIAMAYNVVLVDRDLDHKVVAVGPGQRATSTQLLCSTNHQGHLGHQGPESDLEILNDSNARLQFLTARLADSGETLDHMQQLFQLSPLYRKADESRGWGTLYTSSYYPLGGRASLRWPGHELHQSIDQFTDCEMRIAPSADPAS